MGVFHHQPPPTFVGGRQPHAPQRLPPSTIQVDRPVPRHAAKYPGYAEAVRAWQPPDPGPFQGGWQNYAPRRLNPSITAVAVNDPPFSQRARHDLLYRAVIGESWTPYFPDGIELARRRLPQFVPTVVDDPPLRTNNWLASIMAGWAPRPVTVVMWPVLLQEGQAPAGTEFPPFTAKLPDAVHWATWPIPTFTKQLSLGIPGGPIDDPPPINWASFYAPLYDQEVVYGIQMPSYVPQSNDPVVPTTPERLAAILRAWEPERLFPPQKVRFRALDNPAVVNDPPPFALEWFYTVLAQWQPGPPPIQPKRVQPRDNPAVVNDPPPNSRAKFYGALQMNWMQPNYQMVYTQHSVALAAGVFNRRTKPPLFTRIRSRH